MDIFSDYDHSLVKDTAARLTQDETALRSKLERLFYYVRDDIRFAFPDDGDFVKASETIQLGYGQCNTKATLLLALCKAVGIPARIHFSLISKDIQRGFFSQVLLIGSCQGRSLIPGSKLKLTASGGVSTHSSTTCRCLSLRQQGETPRLVGWLFGRTEGRRGQRRFRP